MERLHVVLSTLAVRQPQPLYDRAAKADGTVIGGGGGRYHFNPCATPETPASKLRQ